MKSFNAFGSIAVLVFFTGCASAPHGGQAAMGSGMGSAVANATQGSGLTQILMSQLGLSEDQAMGGAGSIFSLAKKNLNAGQFGQISQSVPGIDDMIAAAPAPSSSSSALGGLASMAGGGNLGGMASLASSFQSLGMGSGMVSKFVPVVLKYVGAQGGTGTVGLLQSALGF